MEVLIIDNLMISIPLLVLIVVFPIDTIFKTLFWRVDNNEKIFEEVFSNKKLSSFLL